MGNHKVVAEWMAETLNREKILYQVDVIDYIQKNSFEDCYYENDNMNDAISRKVLRIFGKLVPNKEWDKIEKYWTI